MRCLLFLQYCWWKYVFARYVRCNFTLYYTVNCFCIPRCGLVGGADSSVNAPLVDLSTFPRTQLAKRVIACLDVRSNDAGDLVVTKGDQYDVREGTNDEGK